MSRRDLTFRVFVSSTFSDLIAERNVLQEQAFPRLREYCRLKGAHFQAIDLRWGVSEEAALDQQTMEICLRELERSQRLSPRPNFIVLLGDRYGWRPLPARVGAVEFEALCERVPASQRPFLLEWYRRDDNAVPPEYCLRPRRADEGGGRNEQEVQAAREAEARHWSQHIEPRLRALLRDAVSSLHPDRADPRRQPYEDSATHQEIRHGALRAEEPGRHVFAYLRAIDRPPVDEASDWSDNDAGAVDADARDRLLALKRDLRSLLPAEHIYSYEARWCDGRPQSDLEALSARVESDLRGIIDSELAAFRQSSELEREIEAHQEHGRQHAEHFIGRQELLATIRRYVLGPSRQPLVVHGVSGCGKTALMARASADSSRAEAGRPEPLIVARFIGATPASSDVRPLLESLSREIAKGYGDERPVPGDLRELIGHFREQLARSTADRPLVVWIDGLDALTRTGEQGRLPWLPRDLPPHARLIVSALECDGPEGEPCRVVRRLVPADNQVRVDALPPEHAEQLLTAWLRDAGRRLQPAQRWEVLGPRQARLPMSLRLAFDEARRWKSCDAPATLSVDASALASRLLARLEERRHHGRVLVGRALGYVAAARHGLAEDELLDLLSADDEVVADYHRRSPKSPEAGGLPVVVWSRLRAELDAHLFERITDGIRVLTFRHREVADVVRSRYLAGEERQRAHSALADYFQTRWSEPSAHALRELPYHLQQTNQWERLAGLLTTPAHLREFALHCGPYELLEWCDISAQQTDSMTDRGRELDAVCATLGRFAPLLVQEPGVLLQQLHSTVYDQWADFPEVRNWVDRAVAAAPEKAFRVARGPRQPSSPLFRDLGVQEDFVPQIGSSRQFDRLFSATMSGQLRCFDVVSGRLLSECAGAVKGVLSLLVVDEAKVLLGLLDGRVMEWDGESEPSCVFRAPGDYSVNALAVVPERGWLLVGPGQWKDHPQSGTLWTLDLRTYGAVAELDLSDRIILTLDGNWQRRRVCNRDGAQVNQMVSRPGSREIAFAFHHGEVSLFDPDRGLWRRAHSRGGEAVYAAAFDPSGQRLFFADSAGQAGRLVDFDLSSWSPRSSLVFPLTLTAMMAAGGTRRLFLGDWRGMLYTVRQDDLGIEQSVPAGVLGCVRSLCGDPSERLVAASGRGIRVFNADAETAPPEADIDWGWQASAAHGSGEIGVSVAYSPGQTMARATAIDTAKTVGSAPLRNVRCARRVPLALAERISPPGVAVVSLPGLDAGVSIEIPGCRTVHGLAISDDGSRGACLVSTAEGTMMLLFGLGARQKGAALARRFPVQARPGRFTPVAFSADASRLAAVTSQSSRLSSASHAAAVTFEPVTVTVWDLTGDHAMTFRQQAPVGSLAFSADGTRLFIGPGTQAEYRDDPDDLLFVEARRTGDEVPRHVHAIRVFDLANGDELPALEGHTDSVDSLEVSRDGMYLLSAADDGTVRLWDVAGHDGQRVMGFERRPLWAGFTAQPRAIAVACAGWRADLRVVTRVLEFQ